MSDSSAIDQIGKPAFIGDLKPRCGSGRLRPVASPLRNFVFKR
jgi:hypothetical protein